MGLTEFIHATVYLLIIILINVTIHIKLSNRRKVTRNMVERLFDSVRFGTDPKSKVRFKRVLRSLVSKETIRTLSFRNTAIAFMKVAEKSGDPLDKSYCLGWAGRCYEDYGDFALAAICYSAAVEVAPSDVFALERLGDLYSKIDSGKEESLERYSQALNYDPTSSRVYYKLGTVYSNLGENDKAITQYRKSIEVNNSFVSSMAEAAIEYAKKGDKENALKFYLLAMANDIYEFEKLEETIESCLS
ncbi:MAG: tetratricopeptide repeat protein [Oscillospiraceae bacterium]|nr:tetratricopeptide repeat protein [Oscillospiraceae bacterium]